MTTRSHVLSNLNPKYYFAVLTGEHNSFDLWLTADHTKRGKKKRGQQWQTEPARDVKTHKELNERDVNQRQEATTNCNTVWALAKSGQVRRKLMGRGTLYRS